MKDNSKYFVDLISFKTEMRYRGYSLKTENAYLKIVKDFLEATDKEAIEIKREDVTRYLDSKLNTVSTNTVLVYLNALELFFTDILGLNITENIRKYKREFAKKDFLSLKEVKKLIASVTRREKIIYKILFETGMTTKELAAIKVRDIKMEEIKGYKVSKELSREIFSYVDRRYLETDDKLFECEEANLRHINRENTKKFLGKMYSFNDLRHSIALEKFLKKGYEQEAADYLKVKDLGSLRQYYRRAGYDYLEK